MCVGGGGGGGGEVHCKNSIALKVPLNCVGVSIG